MMRARWRRYWLAAALISAIVIIGPGFASAAVGVPAGSRPAAPGPGSVLWSSARDGTGHAVAADPRGGMVFAAGSGSLVDYNSATGATLWDNRAGAGRSVAVTPDGRVVFVINPVVNSAGNLDYSTAAFDTATGKQLWVRRYNGRANGDDHPVALAVSPDSGTVFVTGTSKGRTSGRDYATVAYATATGRQLWVSRYNGRGHGADIAAAIAVSPGGGTVFVTGTSSVSKTSSGFATVAYAGATGTTLWTKRFDRAGARSLAVSPDGRRVFVTGASAPRGSSLSDIATVAYAAATGTQLWAQRYDGRVDRQDVPLAVLVSPRRGGTVIVAGESQTPTDFLAVAYSMMTGRMRWVHHFPGFGQEALGAAAVSPDGRTLYLTGTAYPVSRPGHAVTVAASVGTGATRWTTVIPPTVHGDLGVSVVVSPDGGTVYALVENYSATAALDFTTIALRA